MSTLPQIANFFEILHEIKFKVLHSPKTRVGMILTGPEAFGYEFGVILESSLFLTIAQIGYVFFASTLPGSPDLWYLLMCLTAAVVTIAYDIVIFDSCIPLITPQQIRTCVDLAIFYATSSFFLVGDGVVVQKADSIANEYINYFGSLLSAVFFIPALYLANCSFLAMVRFMVNIVLMVVIGVRYVMTFIGMRRDRLIMWNSFTQW